MSQYTNNFGWFFNISQQPTAQHKMPCASAPRHEDAQDMWKESCTNSPEVGCSSSFTHTGKDPGHTGYRAGLGGGGGSLFTMLSVNTRIIPAFACKYHAKPRKSCPDSMSADPLGPPEERVLKTRYTEWLAGSQPEGTRVESRPKHQQL
jgi:hypothetical protein